MDFKDEVTNKVLLFSHKISSKRVHHFLGPAYRQAFPIKHAPLQVLLQVMRKKKMRLQVF